MMVMMTEEEKEEEEENKIQNPLWTHITPREQDNPTLYDTSVLL